MKRFCASLLALLLLYVAAPARADESRAKAAPEWDWVLHYYMAYDNNLEKCGRPIIDMLKAGITSDKLAIVVSADFTDKDGIKRFLLTKGKEEKLETSEESSADEATLEKELEFVSQRFKAKRYGVVFLNHGGGLGQMSVDENPGKPDGRRWLYPPRVAATLEAWRKTLPGELELVFYQQCGKGSLENYHAMKDSARYVMGSQTVVGAPNRYYTKTVKHLCEHPETDGKELARQITVNETPNMFTTYTTMSCEKLQDLGKRLDAALEPLLAVKDIELPRGLKPCFDFGRAEVFFDGVALLRGLYAANKVEPKELDAFAKWLKEELITSHRVSPDQEEKAGSWCGFSLLFAVNPGLLKRYKDYPFYAETKVDELYTRVYEAFKARRAKRATK
ncbi:MAG: clostripain-related cysteine peptidase [Planctomycetota bacterium]